MSEERKRICLKGGKYHLTENDRDAYRVLSGRVLVYIVPKKDGGAGRRSFLYEAGEGEVLPSFCFCDPDFINWRFCFSALDEAIIEIIESGTTKPLREKFAKKARIKGFGFEGFNGGLVDLYRTNLAAEDSFISRTQTQRGHASEELQTELDRAFGKSGPSAAKTGNPVYDCVAFICLKRHISLASPERLKQVCGRKYDIFDIARLSRFTCREVTLEKPRHKRVIGDLLVFDKENKPFACLACGGSYRIFDPRSGKCRRLSKSIAGELLETAFVIHRPLPARKLSAGDVLTFCKRSVRACDVVLTAVMSVLTALAALVIPFAAGRLFDELIPGGSVSVVCQAGCAAGAFMLANVLLLTLGKLAAARISSKISGDVQNAMYDRLFSLPESVFRKYESADLAQRVMSAGEIVGALADVIVSALVCVVHGAAFFAAMRMFSAELMGAGSAAALIWAAVFFLASNAAIRHGRKAIDLETAADSKMYQFLSGISTLRVSGVEDRALLEYMKSYIDRCGLAEKENRAKDLAAALSTAGNAVCAAVLFAALARGDISAGAFAAFGAAFGGFSANLLKLAENAVKSLSLRPFFERLAPLLEAPEVTEEKLLPGDITGAVEVNNVVFSYSAEEPPVLNGLSLSIAAGEYLGIVGASGCGKSTLLKLLLGLETPDSGKIYYDNKDIESLDKRELRRKMGVVLQDGKLISGSVLENITVTSPNVSAEEIEAVIKASGLSEDTEQMPMGLQTVLNEDGSTISGGQLQRILIARALISHPRILFFDEATSSLDNATQRIVCDTLERMSVTRVVIAHRLSTVMNCSRIIVMEGGRIAQQGTYEELMRRNGLFSAMADRQIV